MPASKHQIIIGVKVREPLNQRKAKRWKKLLLVLLVLVLLSQIPFAYRRYKLGRLHAAIQQLNSQRVVTEDNGGFAEFKGVIHVHSFLGGHSGGNFEEIIEGAKSNQLSFVLMTEHTSEHFNTAAMTLKRTHAGILFINGNEVSTANSDRLLLLPGDESDDGGKRGSTQEMISKAKARGVLALVAYPQDFKSWDASGYDGVEVYNVYTNAHQINPIVMFFDGLWSYRSYPDLLFANFYRRPTENLEKWDQAIAVTGRKLVAFAGNDAHANVGISLNDSSGKTLLGLRLDPYERSFRLVRVHVLVPKNKSFDSRSLLAALAAGHAFIGFDLFCETSGFSFSGSNGTESKIQGDEISLAKGVKLRVNAPVAARILLLKDGNPVQDESGVDKRDYTVTEKGIYRVEVYLPQLPKPAGEQPWIISNPIYVR
jgi:hypothetical protein